MTTKLQTEHASKDETEIYALIERWANAIRDADKINIRADHHDNMLMFDVQPPLMSRGLDAYMMSWDQFFAWCTKPLAFHFHKVEVTAGTDVAYATALGTCAAIDPKGKRQGFEFRLTMGLRKFGNRWQVMHEHHSLPVG
jgi:ketosteroid isomerase-like protein